MQLWPLAQVHGSREGSPLPGSLWEYWPVDQEHEIFKGALERPPIWGFQRKAG